jgi:hypothetical protein
VAAALAAWRIDALSLSFCDAIFRSGGFDATGASSSSSDFLRGGVVDGDGG